MARGEKKEKTPAKWREENIDIAQIAFGGKFEEPKTPYAPQYPYNHVRESEPKPGSDVKDNDPPANCGHIEEWDDTPGAERIYKQHKSGTFYEIHPDGKKVEKIINDRYIIIEKNDHLHIKGEGRCSIDGNINVLVSGNAYIEVLGDCQEFIHGNYNLHIGGNWDIQVDGHLYANSDLHLKFNSERIDLN